MKHAEYRRERRKKGEEPPKPPPTPEYLEKQKVYRQQNRERLAIKSAEWRANNPDKYRTIMRRNKMKKYGITLEDFDRMVTEQNGVCEICKTGTSSLKGDVLSVDHCHKTGLVRSLLCGRCNVIIGHANDDIRLLELMISYIRSHSPTCKDGR